jgi:hypothetical protein
MRAGARKERWTCKDNRIVGRDASQLLAEINLGAENSPAWIAFKNSLTATGNIWYNAAKRQVFKLFGWSLEERIVDFPEWQAITGQDANSASTNPQFPQAGLSPILTQKHTATMGGD